MGARSYNPYADRWPTAHVVGIDQESDIVKTKHLRPISLAVFVLLAFTAVIAAPAPAQRTSRRAPAASADDADFAAFVKSATTRSDFSSPLIDHLPKKSGVPTPNDVLGYHVGAEKKLTYWADQQKWYRTLEKSLPGRVKTEVIGKTEEGREIMIVYLASEAILKNLETNRADLRRLADPRSLSADEAMRIIATNPIYRWQTFGEHAMVFNALMFWNDFPAEAAAPKPATAAQ